MTFSEFSGKFRQTKITLTMKRYNFFFDFDGTLFKTEHLIVNYMNSRYGIKTTIEDWKNNNDNYHTVVNKFKPEHNFTADEVYLDFSKNFLSFFKPEDFHPFDGVKETLQEMYEKYNLYIATSRQEVEKEGLKKILLYHEILDLFSDDIHCVWKYEKNCFSSVTKADFMNSIPGINIGFVDDSIKEIQGAIGSVMCPVLFDPNGHHVGEYINFEIVSSWEQVKREYVDRKSHW